MVLPAALAGGNLEPGRTKLEQDSVPGRSFDLSAGAHCLDFANTLEDRPAPRQHELREATYRLFEALAAGRPAPGGQRAPVCIRPDRLSVMTDT
jgi:hypothetical protein